MNSQDIKIESYNNEGVKQVGIIIHEFYLQTREALSQLEREDINIFYNAKNGYISLSIHVFRHANLSPCFTQVLKLQDQVLSNAILDTITTKVIPYLNPINPNTLYAWTAPDPQRKS